MAGPEVPPPPLSTRRLAVSAPAGFHSARAGVANATAQAIAANRRSVRGELTMPAVPASKGSLRRDLLGIREEQLEPGVGERMLEELQDDLERDGGRVRADHRRVDDVHR